MYSARLVSCHVAKGYKLVLLLPTSWTGFWEFNYSIPITIIFHLHINKLITIVIGAAGDDIEKYTSFEECLQSSI